MTVQSIPDGDWHTLKAAVAIVRRGSSKPRSITLRVLCKLLTDLAAKLEARGTTCGGYRVGCIPWTSGDGSTGIYHNPQCPLSWEYRP